VIKIDENGFLVEHVFWREIDGDDKNISVLVELIDGVEIYEAHPVSDYVSAEVPKGLFKPRWNGTEWVEDLSQEEIEEIKNRPVEPNDIEKLKQENEILKNAQAETNTTLLEFMEAILLGGM